MTIKPAVRASALVLLETLLGFIVICVLPFAWILRDGLGPGPVSTTGLTALSKAFMTFYVGPGILLLLGLDLAIRTWLPTPEAPSRQSQRTTWIIAVVFVIVLSYALTSLLMS